jgi:hypothetical protein
LENGFADHLFRRIAEDPLSGPIPTRDRSVDRLTDDRIVGGSDDRCQQEVSRETGRENIG